MDKFDGGIESQLIKGLESVIFSIQIKKAINGKFLICPIGYGAKKAFEKNELDEIFRHFDVEFIRRDMKHTDIFIDDEYREIDSQPDEIIVPGTKTLLLFEKNIDRAKSLIGGFVWAAENKEKLGIDTIYLAAIQDSAGIAHFSCEKDFEEFMGIERFIKENMPKTYQRLKSMSAFSLLPDYTPPESLRVEKVSKSYKRLANPANDSQKNPLVEVPSAFIRREGSKIYTLLGGDNKVMIYPFTVDRGLPLLCSIYLESLLGALGVDAYVESISAKDDDVFLQRQIDRNGLQDAIFIDEFYSRENYQRVEKLIETHRESIGLSMYVNVLLVNQRLHHISKNRYLQGRLF